ncbi:hypothetical protein ACFY2K_04830 [Kitasatospora sp. NPDC001309]|uniref:hypothetical protein n=1 Tax=Kitasatospora sp. NPDC001309 TaxID=3364013 RepID=UPI0036935B55
MRCVFRWEASGGRCYEERLTLWRAESTEEAIARADEEARRYASDNGVRHLDFAQSYRLATDGRPGDRDEVFSLLRDSGLDGDAYLDRYFDTGEEHRSIVPGE